MISVCFAVTGKLATNSRGLIENKKRCYTSEAKHLVRIDWCFGSGLKWNQLLTCFLFFPQPSAWSSYLSPAKFQIVRASPQLLVTFGSGLCCHHLHTKLAASDLAPCTALTTFFPPAVLGTGKYSMALACLWRCIFCCLYFTWSIDLLGRSRKLHFASPCPLPQKFLFHMGLCCGFGVDNHRKQTAGLIHHQTGVMWV